MKLLNVTCIWQRAPHSAFTDLITFRNQLLCCFRESDEHQKGRHGTIRILKSPDAINWTSIASIDRANIDLRDPKLSVTPNGRLLLVVGGAYFSESKYAGCSTYVAFSDDGSQWSELFDLHLPDEWIWRLTWHNNVAYGASYRFSNPLDMKEPWILSLFKTIDGRHFDLVTKLNVTKYPNETTLRFAADGTMIALVRRRANGGIGFSKPPYDQWTWSKLDCPLGGPNFLILPDGKMIACSRVYDETKGDLDAHTAVGPMTLTSYHPEITLPSGGDTSYAGMTYWNDLLYISYYSSHEGSSRIYLAQLTLQPQR